jgi:hypothetical protein
MLLPLVMIAALAQVPAQNVRPQIGYVYPPGGKAGTTIDVQIGAYDWTPDMQVLMHDPRIKLEITGPAGEPILTPPPYWSGQKAGQAQPPLAREVPARITIPADFPPGPVRWQAANANGGTNVNTFYVSDANEFVEPESASGPRELPAMPLVVNGRMSRITEVDEYSFTVAAAGLVTCRLEDQIGQPFNALLTIRDAGGKLIADSADTVGNGASLSFIARKNGKYQATVHDVEFAGDRGYVYRLTIARGPRVLATLPLVVKRGEKQALEIVGIGMASGGLKPESLASELTVPAAAPGDVANISLDTPAGKAVVSLALGEATDALEPQNAGIANRQLTIPAAISGSLVAVEPASGMPLDRYQFTIKKGDLLRFAVEAARFHSPVDPSLAIIAADGKELARNDDMPGSTDAAIDFKAAADGVYELIVSDVSGTTPSRASVYRLTVENAADALDFTLAVPDQFAVPIGGEATLALKAVRQGAWKSPIAIKLEGAPAGITIASDAAIPLGKNDLKLAFTASDQAAASASMGTLVATAVVGEKNIERRFGPILLAATIKPRCKVKSAVQDGGRIVNRGTTYPADVIIERLEGFTGPVTLQMAATQQRQRRGIRGPTLVVAPNVDTVQYPVFMPEWLETSLTARMNVIGVAEVADPKGNVRHVIGAMDGFIVMSLEGALLKLSQEPGEYVARAGGSVEIPLRVARSARLNAPVRVELVAASELAKLMTAAPVVLQADQSNAVLRLTLADDPHLRGTIPVTIRATAQRDGKWYTASETTVDVGIEPAPVKTAGGETAR